LKTAAAHGKFRGLMSRAVTQGISVSVEAVYLADQSQPSGQRFVFAYTVKIANQGENPAQLRSRHWIITDANGMVEEVRGPGVVGAQPRLRPGEEFEYTSGCVLKTAHGTMRGTYQMFRDDGSQFDAEIAAFPLAMPYAVN
jgi:ApaG protein